MLNYFKNSRAPDFWKEWVVKDNGELLWMVWVTEWDINVYNAVFDIHFDWMRCIDELTWCDLYGYHDLRINVACFYDACIIICWFGSFPLCGSELAEPIDLPGGWGSEVGFLTQ